MDLESKIDQIYKNGVNRSITPLEVYREENAQKIKSSIRVSLFCAPLIVLGFLTGMPIIVFFSFIPSVAFFASAYSRYLKMTTYLRNKYKSQIFYRAIQTIFEDFEYIPRQKIAKHVLVKSMLFPRYIVGVKGEDFMQFRIDNTHLMFCETSVYKSRGKIMFNGIFISASFHKYFKSKVFIISKESSNFLLRIKRHLSRNLNKVYLEDPEFEKSFTVLSNNQLDSRYVLSTSLMKRILDYKKKVKKNISFSLIDNRLYCTIPNFRNLFEPPVFKKMDSDWIKKSLEPVFLYAGLIEDLSLNIRIWSKQ